MKVLVVLVMLLVVSTAFAGEEIIFTADGGSRLSSGSSGPISIDLAADGGATVKFMWLKKDGTVAAGDVRKFDPTAEFGNAFYSLRSEFGPRNFRFSGSGPDSIYVDLTDATEAIATW